MKTLVPLLSLCLLGCAATQSEQTSRPFLDPTGRVILAIATLGISELYIAEGERASCEIKRDADGKTYEEVKCP